MTSDYLLAFLRLALVAGLYLFLGAILISLTRDLTPRSAKVAPAPARPATQRAKLVVVDGLKSNLPEAFEVDGEAVIGRDPACAVCLPPMFVSSRHARLRFAEGGWWIEDLGSRNKTFVGGKEVPAGQPVSIAIGAEIVVAGIRLQLAQI